MRITKQYLEIRVAHLRELTNQDYQLKYCKVYKGYNLLIDDREASYFGSYAYLSAREMQLWVNGIIAGITQIERARKEG